MNSYKIIYLPIELKDREFDAKLFLATSLLDKGFSVVIGQQWAIYQALRDLPKGVILFKSLNKISSSAVIQAKNFGHITLAQEEESLPFAGNKSLDSIFTLLNIEIFDSLDYILCNGDLEKKYHESKGIKSGKLITVGNLRIDILKKGIREVFFKDKVSEIKKRFGKYILINTNFGSVNANIGSVDHIFNIYVQAGLTNPADQDSVNEFNDLVNWELSNLKEIRDFVRLASETFKSHNIIIRPHPAENIMAIENEFKNIKNVYVIRDGSHVPWTMGADFLIHTSCTTGFEARILETTAISIVSNNNFLSQDMISNKVNIVTKNSAEAISKILEYSDSESNMPRKDIVIYEPIIDNILENCAQEKIVKFIEKINLISNEINFPKFPDTERKPFQIQKCFISLHEIENKIKKIFGMKLNINEYKIETLTDSLFFITKENS